MIDQTKRRIQELVPEMKALPGYPYNPDAARAIVELEKLSQKTLWSETLEKSATLMIENYRQQQAADYIAHLEGRWLGSPITLAVVLRAIHKINAANKTLVNVECDGQFLKHWFNFSTKKSKLGPTWNLAKDNYDDQSEATKEFIGEMLGV
jgi:hypothetical protein